MFIRSFTVIHGRYIFKELQPSTMFTTVDQLIDNYTEDGRPREV